MLAATDNANGFRFDHLNLFHRFTILHLIFIILLSNTFICSVASFEAAEWAKTHRKRNTAGNEMNEDEGRPSNYDIFRLAARNLDSGMSYSLDIQEKYGLL